MMSIIAWIVLGAGVGFVASRLVNRRGEGAIPDLALGIAGAFIGGLVSSFVKAAPVDRFSIHSVIMAIVGAIVVLAAYHAVSRHRTPDQRRLKPSPQKG